jgi:hypothetical protein
MPSLHRRQFLQSAAATLATLGVSQLDLHRHSLHYGQILAQDTRRKRALLVGINDYPGSSKRDLTARGQWYRLHGAVNDVMLQRELLIHRFGFHPDQIQVLTDGDATRDGILTQMQTWLIDWVKSDTDVVVFHYSGHGSTVIDPHGIFPDRLNGTIVPFGAQLPAGFAQGRGGPVDDITAGTIFLLREALGRKTKNLTLILDSCYSGGGVRGTVIARSRPGQFELEEHLQSAKLKGAAKLESSNLEQETQQRWLQDLGLSEAEWIRRRRQGEALGVAIFAARRNQRAVDATFAPNLHAGVFTYALTRQLWQQTGDRAVSTVITNAAAKTKQFLKSEEKQVPGLELPQPSAQTPSAEAALMYFTPMRRLGADALIQQVQGSQVELLLTGVEPQNLETIDKGAVFNWVNAQGIIQGTVEIQRRDRLQATGLLRANSGIVPNPGDLLQEQARTLPANLNLRIGLDPSLGQEMAAAAQALRSRPRITPVPLSDQPEPNQTDVDYILGRMLPDYRQDLIAQIQRQPDVSKAQQQAAIAALPEVNQLGLFSVSLDPLPGAFRAATMPVDQVVQQLQTKLKVLLAGRLLRLTLNTTSSRLDVVGELKLADRQTVVGQAFTARGAKTPVASTLTEIVTQLGKLPQIPIRQAVEIVVKNRETQALHIGVLIFSPDGDIDVMFPKTAEPDAALVQAASTQTITGFKFTKPLGIAEVLIVASTAPLQVALRPLQRLAQERRDPQRSDERSAEQTEKAIASLLDDLTQETRSHISTQSLRQLNVQRMAAISIPFEIVEA